MEIHEELCSEHTVDLALAGRVPAHQTLECRRLIRGIVIYVHRWMSSPGLQNQIDDCLECRLLVAIGIGPPAPVPRSAVGIHRSNAEQILATAVASKRVAFKIQKQIAA
jgi:hypothetical protein